MPSFQGWRATPSPIAASVSTLTPWAIGLQRGLRARQRQRQLLGGEDRSLDRCDEAVILGNECRFKKTHPRTLGQVDPGWGALGSRSTRQQVSPLTSGCGLAAEPPPRPHLSQPGDHTPGALMPALKTTEPWQPLQLQPHRSPVPLHSAPLRRFTCLLFAGLQPSWKGEGGPGKTPLPDAQNHLARTLTQLRRPTQPSPQSGPPVF